MKTKKTIKSRFKQLKKQTQSFTYKNAERLGVFLKASIELKPLLSLFKGTEDILENSLNTLETKIATKKIEKQIKQKEKERKKKQVQKRLELENEIPQHIFLSRLEELKKQLPIKQLDPDNNLNR